MGNFVWTSLETFHDPPSFSRNNLFRLNLRRPSTIHDRFHKTLFGPLEAFHNNFDAQMEQFLQPFHEIFIEFRRLNIFGDLA